MSPENIRYPFKLNALLDATFCQQRDEHRIVFAEQRVAVKLAIFLRIIFRIRDGRLIQR
jgi:hypothetical protein